MSCQYRQLLEYYSSYCPAFAANKKNKTTLARALDPVRAHVTGDIVDDVWTNNNKKLFIPTGVGVVNSDCGDSVVFLDGGDDQIRNRVSSLGSMHALKRSNSSGSSNNDDNKVKEVQKSLFGLDALFFYHAY